MTAPLQTAPAPRPWSCTDRGAVQDATGRTIGAFENPRNARFVAQLMVFDPGVDRLALIVALGRALETSKADFEAAALSGDVARRNALAPRLDALTTLMGDAEALDLIVKEIPDAQA